MPNTRKIVINVEPYDTQLALQKLRNEKSPEQDKIINELLQKGGESQVQELLEIIRKIYHQHEIVNKWGPAPPFFCLKRRVRSYLRPLLLITKVITNKINRFISLKDE